MQSYSKSFNFIAGGIQSNTNTLSKKGARRLEKSNSSGGGGCMSEPEFFMEPTNQKPSKARSEQRIVSNGYNTSDHNAVSIVWNACPQERAFSAKRAGLSC